ncbi:MAG: DUF4038 domain-containing protein [Phycisphaeraceae bacterium]|nr:DUF4038 domain-containing protein [Phycisphaeraceae bacterium]
MIGCAWLLATGIEGFNIMAEDVIVRQDATPKDHPATMPAATAPPFDGIGFAPPWTSPFRVDARFPPQLVNREGEHLFILNKTAWAYFACKDPQGYLERAKAQGVNVIRVTLEGQPYFEQLGLDLWPWGGTRDNPDFAVMNEPYWWEVQRRARLAGEMGIGLDVVLYSHLKLDKDTQPSQELYWAEVIKRLGNYANVLTWEIHNEYARNETFQDQVGTYLKAHDPWGRPVCSSNGTTDGPLWPDKPWMDLAITHTCTGSTAAWPLKSWYLAVARNSRSHGKPAFNNETGREVRHQNDDGVHRRKQGWLWCAAGGFWTWHSWDGCEGIDDPNYRGPGHEFVEPMARFFRGMPFWKMEPDFTALIGNDLRLIQASLAEPNRAQAMVYLCTGKTGQTVETASLRLRLPDGRYELLFINPADLAELGRTTHESKGLHYVASLSLPDFTDDLVVYVRRTQAHESTLIPGTQ